MSGSSTLSVPAPSFAERMQRSPLGPPIRSLVSRARLPVWIRHGRPDPAPPHRKQAIVAASVRHYRPATFVETGTYRGDTLALIAPLVRRAISIELDPTLAELARHRFRSQPNVDIRTGDSAAVLPEVVPGLSEPALFWLDGHYSGGPTADSGLCPILAEIDTALGGTVDHVLLIDDIRLFDGTDGYPTLDQLRERIAGHRPDFVMVVENDIARAHAPDRS